VKERKVENTEIELAPVVVVEGSGNVYVPLRD